MIKYDFITHMSINESVGNGHIQTQTTSIVTGKCMSENKSQTTYSDKIRTKIFFIWNIVFHEVF